MAESTASENTTIETKAPDSELLDKIRSQERDKYKKQIAELQDQLRKEAERSVTLNKVDEVQSTHEERIPTSQVERMMKEQEDRIAKLIEEKVSATATVTATLERRLKEAEEKAVKLVDSRDLAMSRRRIIETSGLPGYLHELIKGSEQEMEAKVSELTAELAKSTELLREVVLKEVRASLPSGTLDFEKSTKRGLQERLRYVKDAEFEGKQRAKLAAKE